MIRTLTIGAVLAACFCLSNSAAPALATIVAQATPATVDNANALFKAGKFREAVAMLNSYLAAHPHDARALVIRGDSKAELGDNKGALKDYDAAIKINPNFEYAYVTRCETRLQVDDSTGAFADCNAAIGLNASDAQAYEDRGDIYFDRSSYALALADYNKAIELGRNSAYVYGARCDANRLNGNMDLARADCEKALAIDPKSLRGLWARARFETVSKQYDASIADLSAYLAHGGTTAAAHYYQAYNFNRTLNYRQALVQIGEYIAKVPADPDGYRERGIARYGTGDAKGALADLTTAQNGYRKAGDTANAGLMGTLLTTVRNGQTLTLP